MAVPYTEGKSGIPVATDSRGHTAQGVTLNPGEKAAATSKRNNRHADLNTRTHGGLGNSNTRRK